MQTVRTMSLLEHHVPLSLLLDLIDPQGPRSAEIFELEGAPTFTRSE